MTNQGKQSPVRNTSVGLLLKVAGLFAVSFALFFIIFLAYDLLSDFNKNNTPPAQPSDETKLDVDIPKIADELAKVLSSNNEPYSQEVKDPFFDRGGLSSSATSSSPSNAAGAAAAKGETASASNTAAGTSGKGTTNSGSPETVVEGTKERYEAWLARSVIGGDGTLDPRVFAVEDLTPVGIVDGGNGQQEVMFFSQAAGKTVSFPVGTMFFDAWLTELRPEGVVFSSNDDRRTVRMRSWARSLRNLG